VKHKFTLKDIKHEKITLNRGVSSLNWGGGALPLLGMV